MLNCVRLHAPAGERPRQALHQLGHARGEERRGGVGLAQLLLVCFVGCEREL